MATWFFRNPRDLALALMLIVAMGVSGFLTIGRQEDPTITNLFASITTPYPGADPERVEALVTEKIEAELREIAAIAEIASVSRTGLSLIRIELDELTPKDAIETAWTDVRNALDDARPNLPPGLPAPEFRDDSAGTFTAISALRQRPGDPADPGLLARAAEELRERLRRTLGHRDGRRVRRGRGGDPGRGRRRGADRARDQPRRVSAAIAAADAKVRAGSVRGSGSDLLVELTGEIEDLARIRAIPVGAGASGRADPGGRRGRGAPRARRPAPTASRWWTGGPRCWSPRGWSPTCRWTAGSPGCATRSSATRPSCPRGSSTG